MDTKYLVVYIVNLYKIFKNMKKLFLSLIAIVATVNMFAVTYEAKAQITLTSSTFNCTCVVAKSTELASPQAFPMIMDGREIAFYIINGSEKDQTYAASTLGEMPFGLKTNANTDYTLTISNVSGTETLKMKDEVTGTVFDMTEGYVYNFTAAANQAAISDRFHLYVAPSVPGICHRYGKLQVSGSNGQNVVVKNMDDSATAIGTVAITADYQEIAVEGVLAAGQYKVEWNSQTLIIDVK